MKDITEHQLVAGETGEFEGATYLAVEAAQRGSCESCDFHCADIRGSKIKCAGVVFHKSLPNSKIIGWMRAALADDRDMKLGIEPLDRPIHEFINDLNNCIAAGATHVNADIQVDDRDGFSYISFYAYRKLTAEDLRLAKIAELQASIEAAQTEIDKLQTPALKL